MNMLDRYKKTGGFIQLLTLIESADPEKAQKILNLVAQESAVWAKAIEDKRLTLTRLAEFSNSVLDEAFKTVPASNIAVALTHAPDQIKQKILSVLDPVHRKKVEISEINYPNPNDGEIYASQIKLFIALRTALAEHRTKMEAWPDNLRIPDNFEKELTKTYWNKLLNPVTPLSETEPEPKTTIEPNHKKPTDVTNSTHLVLQNKIDKLTNENTEIKKLLNAAHDQNQQLKTQILRLQKKLDEIKKIVD